MIGGITAGGASGPTRGRRATIAPGPVGRSLSSAVVIHNCDGCAWIGNRNPAGMTPTMVKRESLRSTARPTTPASPPKCSCQTSQLRIRRASPRPAPGLIFRTGRLSRRRALKRPCSNADNLWEVTEVLVPCVQG